MAHAAVARKNSDGKLQALSFDFPMSLRRNFVYFLSDVKNWVCFMLSDGI